MFAMETKKIHLGIFIVTRSVWLNENNIAHIYIYKVSQSFLISIHNNGISYFDKDLVLSF
jgi:hypothetical protein